MGIVTWRHVNHRKFFFKLETKIQIEEYKVKKKEEEDILRQIELEDTRYKQKKPSQLELERIKERVGLILFCLFSGKATRV